MEIRLITLGLDPLHLASPQYSGLGVLHTLLAFFLILFLLGVKFTCNFLSHPTYFDRIGSLSL